VNSLIQSFSPDFIDISIRVAYTCLATIIVNIPFGYFRGHFKKLSFWWFVAIHVPVPIVILLRKFHGLHLTWELAPFLLGAFFTGQFIGKKICVKYGKLKFIKNLNI
jgi:hypothetical protein